MKNTKRTITLALALVLSFALAQAAFAQEGSMQTLKAWVGGINIYVDKQLKTPRDGNGNVVQPIIIDGTTYLPVRAVSNLLGKDVTWDGDTRSIYIGEVPTTEKVVGIENIKRQSGRCNVVTGKKAEFTRLGTTYTPENRVDTGDTAFDYNDMITWKLDSDYKYVDAKLVMGRFNLGSTTSEKVTFCNVDSYGNETVLASYTITSGDEPVNVHIEMYLGTGLRMGEGIPLLWSDIRLDQRIVDVNKKAIIIHDYATHSATTQIQDFCKTDSSIRKVVITNGLVEILREHKAKMMEQAEKQGREWSEDSLVFPNTVGNIVNSRNLQNTLKRIYKKAGITDATMHTLRHTYASNCFSVGVDIKALSEQLGHKTVKTTYNIYVHLLDDTKVKEIDKLNEIDRLFQSETGANVIQFPTGQKAV